MINMFGMIPNNREVNFGMPRNSNTQSTMFTHREEINLFNKSDAIKILGSDTKKIGILQRTLSHCNPRKKKENPRDDFDHKGNSQVLIETNPQELKEYIKKWPDLYDKSSILLDKADTKFYGTAALATASFARDWELTGDEPSELNIDHEEVFKEVLQYKLSGFGAKETPLSLSALRKEVKPVITVLNPVNTVIINTMIRFGLPASHILTDKVINGEILEHEVRTCVDFVTKKYGNNPTGPEINELLSKALKMRVIYAPAPPFAKALQQPLGRGLHKAYYFGQKSKQEEMEAESSVARFVFWASKYYKYPIKAMMECVYNGKHVWELDDNDDVKSKIAIQIFKAEILELEYPIDLIERNSNFPIVKGWADKTFVRETIVWNENRRDIRRGTLSMTFIWHDVKCAVYWNTNVIDSTVDPDASPTGEMWPTIVVEETTDKDDLLIPYYSYVIWYLGLHPLYWTHGLGKQELNSMMKKKQLTTELYFWPNKQVIKLPVLGYSKISIQPGSNVPLYLNKINHCFTIPGLSKEPALTWSSPSDTMGDTQYRMNWKFSEIQMDGVQLLSTDRTKIALPMGVPHEGLAMIDYMDAFKDIHSYFTFISIYWKTRPDYFVKFIIAYLASTFTLDLDTLVIIRKQIGLVPNHQCIDSEDIIAKKINDLYGDSTTKVEVLPGFGQFGVLCKDDFSGSYSNHWISGPLDGVYRIKLMGYKRDFMMSTKITKKTATVDDDSLDSTIDSNDFDEVGIAGI